MCIRSVNKCLINTIRTKFTYQSIVGNFVEGLLKVYKSLIIGVIERKFHVIFAVWSESSGDKSSFVPWSDSSRE